MSVINSIIHTSPLQANEGIGFTPVFLSISFQGSTAQSAQSNFGTIPLQVTILWPREFGGQAVPVIRHISWTELVSNFESQSVPQLMIPFLPLPPSFNPLSEASWSVLARQVETWLVDTIRDVRAPEWAWGCDAFWMAFIAANPDFPRGPWPNWNPKISLEGKFIESWTADNLTIPADSPLSQDILDEIRTSIWDDFQLIFTVPPFL
ncbi:hypothetical protein DEU56DRAFT_840241 [Suillus clintonianus]|uniref:uncharacterized protein n=1 Tax=Suillus clintonianus TaxID=1904413 RepID=UPI001B86BC1A|nr:uncharacterized protein DEU56DRAFT_840241 [Suillus clintonianus]KAG2116395.1 hypothetical protein DEU56DRAFT_840241 [Suillus clintonianus]